MPVQFCPILSRNISGMANDRGFPKGIPFSCLQFSIQLLLSLQQESENRMVEQILPSENVTEIFSFEFCVNKDLLFCFAM